MHWLHGDAHGGKAGFVSGPEAALGLDQGAYMALVLCAFAPAALAAHSQTQACC